MLSFHFFRRLDISKRVLLMRREAVLVGTGYPCTLCVRASISGLLTFACFVRSCLLRTKPRMYSFFPSIMPERDHLSTSQVDVTLRAA